MQQELMMDAKLRNFLTTPNLEVAWRCYQDWCAFQEKVGRENEVGLAGCSINGKTCWKVLITQDLHDERISFSLEQLAHQEDENCSNDRHRTLAIRAAVILLVVLL